VFELYCKTKGGDFFLNTVYNIVSKAAEFLLNFSMRSHFDLDTASAGA